MKKYIIPILACMALAGCIENNTVSTGEAAKEYLGLWMENWNKQNGKDVKPTDLGLYIIEDTTGTGDVRDNDSTWVYALFTIRTLGGAISSTDDEDLAKQLGTYVEGAWYGPKYAATGEGVNYAGVEALMNGMKLGGTRRAIVPSWLLTTSRYSTQQSYLDACTSSTHLDYTVTLVDQTSDVIRHQSARIADFMNTFYPGAASEAISEDATDNGSFWFVSTYTPADAAEREETASMSNQLGRYVHRRNHLDDRRFQGRRVEDEVCRTESGRSIHIGSRLRFKRQGLLYPRLLPSGV